LEPGTSDYVIPLPDRGDRTVSLCLAGDEAAWADLYRGHAPAVTRFLRCLLGPRPEIEDLVQEVFADVLASLPRFRTGSRLRPWIVGIAANVAREHARSEARRLRRAADFGAWMAGGGGGSPDPCGAVEARETLAVASVALGRMSLRCRTAWVMCDVEGLACDETARALGTTAVSVRLRLMRARRIVQGTFREAGVSLPGGWP
jgi:RNA polymerase sigma-70 factor (ECF subfamily)